MLNRRDCAARPVGAWRSPISAQRVAAGTPRFAELRLDGEWAYWREGRRSEGGRAVVMRQKKGEPAQCMTPAGYNVRSLVYEYGGRSFGVAAGRTVFANFEDQRLYWSDSPAHAEPITSPGPFRFAEPVMAETRVICVREDRRLPGEPKAALVDVSMSGEGFGEILFDGADFVAAPALSPDGRRLAWLAWDHPHMPFDQTRLMIAELGPDGGLRNVGIVAEGAAHAEPHWSPQGILHFVSDVSGWWNLYRVGGHEIVPVLPVEAEFTTPLWFLGTRSYDFLPDGRPIAARNENGLWRLAAAEPEAPLLLDPSWSHIAQLSVGRDDLVFVGAGPKREPCVARLDLATGETEIVAQGDMPAVPAQQLSAPEALCFATDDGAISHGFYYPPLISADEPAPEQGPPLIVMAHGGPDHAATATLDMEVQYFTSRGFAWLDVNYAGSSGYGRAYRHRLDGQWGIVDVGDCIAGARRLVQLGLADPRRLVIRGQSAGGFLVLRSLCESRIFAAGSCHYGPSDLERLHLCSHKYEASYMTRLIGPYPEQRQVYRDRSPILSAGSIRSALILFQGSEDRVVPPDQSRSVLEAARRAGATVAYHEFPGEQHGFRRSETIVSLLEAELDFFNRFAGPRDMDS